MNSTVYLAHHGVKGQKWGVRRYQNEDGSLTDAGKRRYGYELSEKGSWKYERKRNRAYKDLSKNLDKAVRKEAKASKKYDRAVLGKGLINKYKNAVDGTGSHWDKKFDDWMRAESNRKEIERRMSRTLDELNMDPVERSYRKSGYEYTKYLRGNKITKVAAASVGGSMGLIGYYAYRASTPEAKRLAANRSAASKEYRDSWGRR